MKKFRENIFFLAVFISSIILQGQQLAIADDNDIWAVQGGGSLYNIDVVKVDENGVFRIYNTDIILGSQGIAPSVSSGGYYGIQLPCNNIGSAWTAGDVVISSNTGTGNCRIGAALNDATNVLGIAVGSSAGGGVVSYYRASGYALAHTTGTVAIGDILVTTAAAAGYLTADNTPTDGAIVGKALSAGTASGGNTLILLK